MTNEDAFEIWAPRDAQWSEWVKPALFAQMAGIAAAAPPESSGMRDPLWLPAADGRTIVIVDLPGAASVATGLALARRGYRPVPLYNTSFGPSAIVDVVPIARQLLAGINLLRTQPLRADAPPAFLIDANRLMPSVPPAPGKFDNRWVVFPQDFPSGTLLRSKGVVEALLIHDGVKEDLAHVLLRWQQAGIRIVAAGPGAADDPRELVVTPPSMFRRAWYRALTMAGLRRNNAGGFGAAIPIRAAGGGFG